ncbi:hypothetical protein KAW80_01655 [Candidatus Babeliales bacterium]|nr:hypothetical protein [Candidatus Babeliales bacterium]
MSRFHLAANGNGATKKMVEEPTNFITRVIERFNMEEWLRYIGITTAEAVSIFYYFAAAFFVGFVFKKYFKFVIGCAFVVGVLAVFLESHNALVINWPILKELVGVDPSAADFNNVWVGLSSWISDNLYLFLGGTVGFILGYKLG